MIKRFIQNRYRSYKPDGKFWLTVGALVLAVDMAIAYYAGATVTVWHGLGFACCALAFAFLPDAAYEEYDNGRYLTAAVLAVLCLPIGVQAYQQQLTYSAGMRTGDIQQTRVQNAKYDGSQESVKEAKANLVIFTKQLETLTQQAPWAATVKADRLREQAADIEKSIASEGKLGGCGRKCRGLQDDLTKVRNQIAVAEQRSDIEARIEATEKVIKGARAKADKTEYKSSVIANVAAINAQLVKIIGGASATEAYEVDEISMNYANVASAGLGSLALLILAPISFFLAGRRRYTEGEGTLSTPTHTNAQDRPSPSHTREIVKETKLLPGEVTWRDLRNALRAPQAA